MRDGMKPESSSSGSAGAQRSFLEDCWELAHPTHSGARGSAGARDDPEPSDQRSCAPERSHRVQGRYSPRDMSDSGERSCAPGESNDHAADWAGAAKRLLATCPYPDLHDELTAFFDETAAILEYERGLSRQEAEQRAFGHLLFELLRRFVAVQSVPTDPRSAEESNG